MRAEELVSGCMSKHLVGNFDIPFLWWIYKDNTRLHTIRIDTIHVLLEVLELIHSLETLSRQLISPKQEAVIV